MIERFMLSNNIRLAIKRFVVSVKDVSKKLKKIMPTVIYNKKEKIILPKDIFKNYKESQYPNSSI